MKYDFDEIIDRRGTGSVKWDTIEGVLPMWVADMDFRAAQPIIDALRRRVEHGVFGYVKVPEKYYDAIVSWFGRRHGWRIEPGWILYTIGVVPAISAIIKAFTQPGDDVAILTPVYNCFFSSITNNGCRVADVPLAYDGEGGFSIDYDALEEALAAPQCKLLVMCNPHNPAGRVWTRQELERVGQLCIKHGVITVSDEIHCEITLPGIEYTPMGSVSQAIQDNCITCASPSKAFNIAGLQNADIITNNPEWRKRIDRAININEVCDVNPFGVEALVAAYNEGAEWLDQMRAYVASNYDYARGFFAQRLPQLKVAKLQGTYLMWVDCKALGMKSEDIERMLIDKAKVWVLHGSMYGKAGEGFIRINLACPRAQLTQALERIAPVLAAAL